MPIMSHLIPNSVYYYVCKAHFLKPYFGKVYESGSPVITGSALGSALRLSSISISLRLSLSLSLVIFDDHH